MNISPTLSFDVYSTDYFRGVEGVSDGEALSFADELVMDDVYRLKPNNQTHQLSIESTDDPNQLAIGEASTIGTQGNTLVLDSCLTFVGRNGSTVETLVFVEVADGMAENICIYPFSIIEANMDYRLIGIDRHVATTRLFEIGCVSFTKGTRITLRDGRLVPIEELKVGDRVLTRDAGPQTLRWIGQVTLRAEGALAPIVIKTDTLQNSRDLHLSPEHRLFIYPEGEDNSAAELVKASELVDGNTIYRKAGGYVDYYQLLFDQHQIIYAEGIATESLLIDPRTRNALPNIHDKAAAGTQGQREYQVHENIQTQSSILSLLRNAKTD